MPGIKNSKALQSYTLNPAGLCIAHVIKHASYPGENKCEISGKLAKVYLGTLNLRRHSYVYCFVKFKLLENALNMFAQHCSLNMLSAFAQPVDWY